MILQGNNTLVVNHKWKVSFCFDVTSRNYDFDIAINYNFSGKVAFRDSRITGNIL